MTPHPPHDDTPPDAPPRAGDPLRQGPPPGQGVIVTIDGPAGTGKSSVAADLADELGLEFLDTGAMYRAAAAIVIHNNLQLEHTEPIVRLIRAADIRFDWSTTPPTLIAFGDRLTDRLREPDVAALVSPVAGIPDVRTVLVEKQRRIGEAHPRLVSEGRDQGSVVFPNADVKFYLDASVETRTHRRVAQLERAGHSTDPASVRDEIESRDRRDSTRAVAPLVCPPDAVRVTTDDLDQPGVVALLAQTVRQRIPADRLAEAARLA